MATYFNTGADYYPNPDVVIPPILSMGLKPKHQYMLDAFKKLQVPITSTPSLYKTSATPSAIKEEAIKTTGYKPPVDWTGVLAQAKAATTPKVDWGPALAKAKSYTTNTISGTTPSAGLSTVTVPDVVSGDVTKPVVSAAESAQNFGSKAMGFLEKATPWLSAGMGIADSLFANNAQRQMNKKLEAEIKDLRGDIKRSFGGDTELVNTSRGSMNTARMMSAMSNDPNQQNALGQMYMGDLSAMQSGLRNSAADRSGMRQTINRLESMKQPVRSDFVAGLTGGLQGLGAGLGLGGYMKVFNSGDMDTILKHYFGK